MNIAINFRLQFSSALLLYTSFCFLKLCFSQPILSEDFETEKLDGFYSKLVQHNRLSLDSVNGQDGSVGIRAEYVGYNQGSQRIVVNHPLPQPLIEATLNFDVMFEDDFQWVRGGKLHGFGPKNRVTGGNPMQPDGWSARAMFHADGRVNSYSYHQNQMGQYGEAGVEITDYNLAKGIYHAISYHIKVNDPPDSSNGSITVFINGLLISNHGTLKYRELGGDTTAIYSLLFSTFHGGSEDTWAPKNSDGTYATVHAVYDNFAVFPYQNIRGKPGPDALPVISKKTLWYLNNIQSPYIKVFSLSGQLLKILDPNDLNRIQDIKDLPRIKITSPLK